MQPIAVQPVATQPAAMPATVAAADPSRSDRHHLIGRHHRRRTAAFAVILIGLFVALDVVAIDGWRNSSSAGAVNTGRFATAAGRSMTPVASAGPAPIALDIPSIRIHSRVVDLHLRADGSLAVPDDFSKAGWWAEGTAPGDAGAAVIVGHVDSLKGAAVFYHLRDLAVGADVIVHRADASVEKFTIQAVREYPKAALPAAVIYGRTETPTLRLITCGGKFDRRRHTYTDNVVAFAQLAPAALRPGRPQ